MAIVSYLGEDQLKFKKTDADDKKFVNVKKILDFTCPLNNTCIKRLISVGLGGSHICE